MIISKEQFSLLMTSATKAGEIEGVKAFIDRLISNLTEAKAFYEKQRLPVEEKDLPILENWHDAIKNPPPLKDYPQEFLIYRKDGLVEFDCFTDGKWVNDPEKIVLWCQIPPLPQDVLKEEIKND